MPEVSQLPWARAVMRSRQSVYLTHITLEVNSRKTEQSREISNHSISSVKQSCRGMTSLNTGNFHDLRQQWKIKEKQEIYHRDICMLLFRSAVDTPASFCLALLVSTREGVTPPPPTCLCQHATSLCLPGSWLHRGPSCRLARPSTQMLTVTAPGGM